MEPLYTGPCEILKRFGNTGRYLVALPTGEESVHMERLKLYIPAVSGSKVPLQFIRPAKIIPTDDTYVVEKILGHRIRHGRHQWLVKWKGYDSTENTWEPATHFIGGVEQTWLEYNRSHKIDWNTAI